MASVLGDLAVEREEVLVVFTSLNEINSINFLSTLFNLIYLKGTLPL